jgi:HD-GYP domain-containing protein (c-di-GMP phosphodiesterase class II)
MKRPSLSEALRILTEIMTAKNPRLLEHGERTARYAVSLGHAIGLSAHDLIDLYYAAMLHDIGQTELPDEIVQKNGPLTHEEYVQMQCHPRDGARLLETIPALRRAALLVAHHHEHWNGSGYPYGLRGAYIPLGSRILAVADRFDAMNSEKNGSRGDPRLIMKLMRMLAGSQLDPRLVGVFAHRLEKNENRMCFIEPSSEAFGARVPLAPAG